MTGKSFRLYRFSQGKSFGGWQMTRGGKDDQVVGGRTTRPWRAAVALAAGSVLLASCSAATTALNKQDLDVQTHMSETIFLDPVPDNRKTIYVAVRNTSDHPELDLSRAIAAKLGARGYSVVPNPNTAQFIMQLNVLQAGPVDPRGRDSLLASSYGSGLGSLALGAGAGGLTQYATGNSDAAVGVGLGVALASFVADQLVKDNVYAVVTDIQISTRPVGGGKVQETRSTRRGTASGGSQAHSYSGAGASEGAGNSNGSSSANSNSRDQFITTSSDYLKYNVRNIAYANQVNLKFERAAPVLIDRLSSSVANLFD